MQEVGYLYDKWKKPEFGKRPWRVGKVHSYLFSLKLFLEFGLTENKYVSRGKCQEILLRIKQWVAGLRSKALYHSQEVREVDDQNLLTWEDLAKYRESSDFKRAVQTTNQLSDVKNASHLSLTMIVNFRTSLILRLLLENGQRTGAIISATGTKFNQAIERDSVWVMKVRNHKTFLYFGSCNEVMSAELHNDLIIWINIVRSHLLSQVSEVDGDNASNDNIFLDYTGNALESSHYNHCLTAHIEEALGKSSFGKNRFSFRCEYLSFNKEI